jgi:hypothetical protein
MSKVVGGVQSACGGGGVQRLACAFNTEGGIIKNRKNAKTLYVKHLGVVVNIFVFKFNNGYGFKKRTKVFSEIAVYLSHKSLIINSISCFIFL